MSDTTPEQLAGNWNQVARLYADHIDPMTGQYAGDAVDLLDPGPDDRVLDVASGAGAATVIVARRAGEVVAADFSSVMVAGLQERVAAEGITNVTVEEMDAQALGFDDDGFDGAISVFGAMIVPDRVRAFAEMARVTRPGGRVVVTSWQAPPHNDWMAIFRETVQRAMPDADPPPPPHFMELADPDRFRDELAQAGLVDVELTSVTHQSSWASPAVAWAALAESNPVFGPALAQLDEAVVAHIRSTFDDVIDDHGGPHMTAGAHIATGRAA